MTGKLAEILDSHLPTIITGIARKYNIAEYVDAPDFADPRLVSWHQFGLLTHTREVLSAFKKDVPAMLNDVGIYSKVLNKLEENKINGRTKRELLEAAIILHDLGKIPSLGNTSHDRNHEEMSVKLLNEDPLYSILASTHLREDQMKYITRCVSTHDVLGEKVRDVLKHEGNLTLAFLNAGKARPLMDETREKYSDVSLEIGIFFACDTIGKTSLRYPASRDDQIVNYEQTIEQELHAKNLNPSLKKAVMQYPVTIRLARLYFESIMPYLSSS